MKTLLAPFALLIAAIPAWAATSAPAPSDARYKPELDQAFARLYSSDFDGAQTLLDQYIRAHPEDPVAYSVKASGYVFSELHRLGILESDFFQDDKRINDHKKELHPDPKVRTAFFAAVTQAQDLANRVLSANPNDTNALFALCLAKGNLTDYTALIDKHQMQSLSINKDGYRTAKKLVGIAPDYYDAYLTTGFTEYLIGSIPVVFRWFMKFDDVQGDKKQGVKSLQLVADKGHYLKPFAKILLATAYLREKKFADARALLRELTDAYPQNALLKHELDRLSARM